MVYVLPSNSPICRSRPAWASSTRSMSGRYTWNRSRMSIAIPSSSKPHLPSPVPTPNLRTRARGQRRGLRSAERGDFDRPPLSPAAFGSAYAFGRFLCVSELLSLAISSNSPHTRPARARMARQHHQSQNPPRLQESTFRSSPPLPGWMGPRSCAPWPAPMSSPGARISRPATVGRQHPAQALGAVLAV